MTWRNRATKYRSPSLVVSAGSRARAKSPSHDRAASKPYRRATSALTTSSGCYLVLQVPIPNVRRITYPMTAKRRPNLLEQSKKIPERPVNAEPKTKKTSAGDKPSLLLGLRTVRTAQHNNSSSPPIRQLMKPTNLTARWARGFVPAAAWHPGHRPSVKLRVQTDVVWPQHVQVAMIVT